MVIGCVRENQCQLKVRGEMGEEQPAQQRRMVEQNSSHILFDEARMSSHESNASASGDSTGTPDTTESFASSEVT